MKKHKTKVLKMFGVIVVILVVALAILERLGFRFISKEAGVLRLLRFPEASV